jgi:phosphatidylglycerol:prolipoprotein diacylglycerol transferase
MSHEPLVPYVQLPELVLVPANLFGNGLPPSDFSIKPFGTLVAIGVYVGAWLATRYARRIGLDERRMASFIVWVVATGFVVSHVLDVVFYYPERLLRDPLSVLRLWDGLSSYGGFVGAILGALIWRWRKRLNVLPYAEAVASAFPVAWVFGRAGCSVAHDHPGLRSDAWLAVRYPDGGRFDLGLLEMLLTVPLAAAFLLLRKRPRPIGFFVSVMSVAYAPTRLALDFLRSYEPVYGSGVVAAIDPRYGPFTPAQWASVALLVFGAVLFVRVHSRPSPARDLSLGA